MHATSYRYQLPKKAIKSDCPACGCQYKKSLSQYVDTQTGEPLPTPYGRCDRESNCRYHLSPYHKGASGISYADEQKRSWQDTAQIPKAWFRLAGKQKRNGVNRQHFIQAVTLQEGATSEQAERVANFIYDDVRLTNTFRNKVTPAITNPVYVIPDSVFQQSLEHYNNNQFARLLRSHFGVKVTDELLTRFQIGTSGLWPGACVFWYIDEQEGSGADRSNFSMNCSTPPST